jgi:hypothetical protein
MRLFFALFLFRAARQKDRSQVPILLLSLLTHEYLDFFFFFFLIFPRFSFPDYLKSKPTLIAALNDKQIGEVICGDSFSFALKKDKVKSIYSYLLLLPSLSLVSPSLPFSLSLSLSPPLSRLLISTSPPLHLCKRCWVSR